MAIEKKFKFSDRPLTAKIVYGVVIAILCITAIVVGIVAAASKAKDTPAEEPNPPVSEGEGNNNTPTPPPEDNKNEEAKPTVYVSPVVGQVSCEHSMDTPVFSDTLGEWKLHTGIDITTDEAVAVYAAASGVISAIYDDPMMGHTVEIQHTPDIKTVYSNLAPETTVLFEVGDEVESGDRIGTVGDTSLSEIAEEPHLHFEFLVKEIPVNPLDYLSEESKKASLGIG